jgi:hypothetical protein
VAGGPRSRLRPQVERQAVRLGRQSLDASQLTPGVDGGIELPQVSSTAQGAHALEQWRSLQRRRAWKILAFPPLALIVSTMLSGLGLGFFASILAAAAGVVAVLAPGLAVVWLLRSRKATRALALLPAMPRASLRRGAGPRNASPPPALADDSEGDE